MSAANQQQETLIRAETSFRDAIAASDDDTALSSGLVILSLAHKTAARLAAAETALQEIAHGIDHAEGLQGHAEFYEAVQWAQDIARAALAVSPDAAAPSVCSRCMGTDPDCYICARFASPDAAAKEPSVSACPPGETP